MDAGCTEKEKQYKESCKKGEGGIVTSVVIMRWMAACHGWLVNGIDARLLSLSAACGGGGGGVDTILSCASILHVGAEAYGLLMPSLALGNNIVGKGRAAEKEGGRLR